MRFGKVFTKAISLTLCLLLIIPSFAFADATSDYTGHWAEEVLSKWQEKGCLGKIYIQIMK